MTPPPGDTFARSPGAFFRGDELTFSSDASSSCLDAGPFRYAWTLTDPAGSSATLSSSSASTPSFTADIPSGAWNVSLIVTDRFGHQSQTAATTLTSGACGASPITVYITDQTQGKAFDPHALSASAYSADDDGSRCPSRFANTYSYQWSVTGPSQRYSLSDLTGNPVTFAAGDVGGWTLSVIATGSGSGLSGTTSASTYAFCNPGPVVGSPYVLSGASFPRTGDFNAGDTITLATPVDVSSCYTSRADAQLTYAWTLANAPDDTSNSPAPLLFGPTTATPSFQVTVPGQHLLASATVTDKWGHSGTTSAEFSSSP